jgi:hypothetical protein
MNNTPRYILLDSARMGFEIMTAKELNPKFDSLYRGRKEEPLAAVAPFLFPFQKSEFIDWFLQKGWGDSWGILALSKKDLKSIFKHFRQFLMVKTEGGEEFYFRFYDPRVLRVFLPTCDRHQLSEFFGPVDYFICEDEDPSTGTVFSFDRNELVSIKISKDEIVSFEPNNSRRSFSFF